MSGPKLFVKGQSGNPGGRAKGLDRVLREELKSLRVRLPMTDDEGRPVLSATGEPAEEVVDGYKAMFYRLWSIISTGQDKDALVAIKLLYERTHGLLKQTVQVDDGNSTAPDVDWSALPLDQRRAMLAGYTALGLTMATTGGDEPTEH